MHSKNISTHCSKDVGRFPGKVVLNQYGLKPILVWSLVRLTVHYILIYSICNGNSMTITRLMIAALTTLTFSSPLLAEQIGSVDTVFKIFGPDHKIIVEAFDDPDVKNVTCYISRAKTGGIKGGLGLAEDTSDAAISCQQVGPVELSDKIAQGKAEGEVVFRQRTSLIFKKLQVVRFFDKKRNALVYLTYSDKVVDGSPKNALSAVPIMPWH